MERRHIRYSQFRRIFSNKNVKIGLLILAIGVTLLIMLLLFFPKEAPSAVITTLISATASFTGAYLSYGVVRRHVISTEQDRIASRETVVDHYEDKLPLLGLVHLTEIVDISLPERLPVFTLEEAPDCESKLTFGINLTNNVYKFPDSIRGFFGPYFDEIESRFETEGKFNSRKARLDRIEGTNLHIGETTYFRSFCTNFAPDLNLPNNGPTLREEFDHEFIRGDQIVSLADSPFSNHLGGGGLLITADGFAILGFRTADVTVGEQVVGNSFGGNFEYKNLHTGANPEDELLREATEEIKAFDKSSIRELIPLALIRRVDWLGKPDIHAIAFADELDNHTQTHEEFYDGLSVDLGIDQVESIHELFNAGVARSCVKHIATAADQSAFEPSVNLLLILELWLRVAEDRSLVK